MIIRHESNVVSLDGSDTGGCDTGGCGPCGGGSKSGQGGGCGGGGGGHGALPAEYRVKDHPCYSEEAHHHFARMHVAVAPACNVQCNYCNRKYDCANESRPGVTSAKVTPEQALELVCDTVARLPQLSVVGIAGPGDALANPEATFRTCALITESFPHLKLCLSTNGLMLPDFVDQIVAHEIGHVTITINSLDPEIGKDIYAWVAYKGKRYTGAEGARILQERQLEGLAALTAQDVLVKVNSVLIPGINDHHLETVNAVVSQRGAFVHNVVPLISDPAHGTAFGLAGQREPSADELAAIQDALGGNSKVMRHCRQCRADAVGLLAGDGCAETSAAQAKPAKPVAPGAPRPEPRHIYRKVINAEIRDRERAKLAADAMLAELPEDASYLVAVATKGGGRVNEHFGHMNAFAIYRASREGILFMGYRRVDRYCQGGGDDERLQGAIQALEGVTLILVAKVGERPRTQLEEAGFLVVDTYAQKYIETAVATEVHALAGIGETMAATA